MYKTSSKLLVVGIALAVLVGLSAGWANAEIILVNEDFQTPLLGNDTASPAFPGWTYVGGNAVKSRLSTSQGDLPGDDNFDPNQAMQLEWNNNVFARYALTHAWSADDVFTLNVNASPQAWNIHQERWIRPKIRQNSDNTVLWDPGETAETKLFQGQEGEYAWNGPGPYGNSTWQEEPDTLYTFTIDASDFTAGTPGETIYLELGSSGYRGMYYDNVELMVSVIPEPSAFVLLGFAVLGLLGFRRRR